MSLLLADYGSSSEEEQPRKKTKTETDQDFFGLDSSTFQQEDALVQESEPSRKSEDNQIMPYEEYAAQFKHIQHTETQDTQGSDDEFLHIPEYRAARKYNQNAIIETVTDQDIKGDMWKYEATRDALREAEEKTGPSQFGHSRASAGRRRNNNIMYLAYQAHVSEKAHEEAVARSKTLGKAKREKYGF